MRDLLFSLLRCSLFGIPIDLQDAKHLNWDSLLALTNRHKVTPLAAEGIISLNPPEKARLKAKQSLHATIIANSMINHELAYLTSLLRGYGFEPILLKGPGIALNYPKPEYRPCGDIDLLIQGEDYKRAKMMLRQVLSDSASYSFEDEKSIAISHNDVTTELHHHISPMYHPKHNRALQSLIDDTLTPEKCEAAKFEGVNVNLPNIDFNAFYIFYHIWHHIAADGIGLRQLCDLAMLLHARHSAIDTQRLAEMLKSTGLTRAWKAVGGILVDNLGLPESEMPLYDPAFISKSEKLLNGIMDGGNFGKGHKAVKNRDKSNNALVRRLRSLGILINSHYHIFSLAPSEALYSMKSYIIKGMHL